MRYLSLFSGIEACTMAWDDLGWEPVAFAEIDPFPAAVLEHHYPGVPNLGDVAEVTDQAVQDLGRIDIVVGGSPCQDLSVAGKRAGLAGARSSLFHHQWRIFDAARRLCGARFLLWENVPGAFSTHGGRDFAVVVNTLAGTRVPVPGDGWGTEGVALGDHGLLEWAVLDAQWFGVAQRRRRVFAVLDAGDWRGRPPVLLEPEGLRGDSPPRREAGQGAAGTLKGGAGERDYRDPSDGNGGGLVPEVCGALNHSGGHAVPGNCAQDWNAGMLVPEVANPLTARMHKGINSTVDEGQTPIVMAFDTTQVTHPENRSRLRPGDPSPALAAGAHPPAIAFKPGSSADARSVGAEEEVCPSLEAGGGGNNRPAVAFAEVSDPIATNQGKTWTREGENNFRVSNVAVSEMQVRRLTPVECERLQGFPDDYTRIPYKGKPAEKCPDGPRYKALGNSMAVPVMAWIGKKLNEVMK